MRIGWFSIRVKTATTLGANVALPCDKSTEPIFKERKNRPARLLETAWKRTL